MNKSEPSQMISNVYDYLYAGPRLFVKLKNINEVGNSDYVYEGAAGDIEFVLYLIVEYPTADDGLAAAPVTKDMMKNWMINNWSSLDKFDIFEAALKNTALLFHPQFGFLDKQNMDVQKLDLYDARVESLASEANMLIITSHTGMNGSALAFLTGVLDRACEVFDSDIYVAFLDSSAAVVHSTKDVTALAIAESLNFSDETCGKASISEKVYRYHAGNHYLMPVDRTVS